MKIRVATPDAASAGHLVQQLAGIGDATVHVDGPWAEVDVRPGPNASTIVGRVLHAIEDWLDQNGVSSAAVHLDDRAHVMSRTAPATEAVV